MSPRRKDNTERINVFFSKTILDVLKEKAAALGTSVSGLVRMIVMEWIGKNK